MKSKISRAIVILLFILGLIYILAPGPTSVKDFKALDNSFKSTEPGDTVQTPNIVAYYSDYDRAGITKFYRDNFRNLYSFGGLVPPVILNYPPEDGKMYIRDQIVLTFMEEYIYPLRGSVYVGGYEPFIESNIKRLNHNFVGDHIQLGRKGRYYASKTTLRYYPTPIYLSLPIYLGIWVALYFLFKLSKKVFK